MVLRARGHAQGGACIQMNPQHVNASIEQGSRHSGGVLGETSATAAVAAVTAAATAVGLT
jgi:hypothetical protein